MNRYIYKGAQPQLVTLLGAEVALQPETAIELPDCDYVQTLIAKGLLVAEAVKTAKKGVSDNAS